MKSIEGCDIFYVFFSFTSLSISLSVFWSVILAQICVVAMDECPIILAMLSVGVPASKVSVPKQCLAMR